MDIVIYPQKLSGTVTAIPSKSQAHRLMICAAFADRPTTLICPDTNRDIAATVDCLNALGAVITRTQSGYRVIPMGKVPETALLNCCESGSTLRFMLPIVGALGVDATFQMAGRLPHRPLSPLWEEMERMGCRLTRPTEDTLRCQGRLSAGEYSIDGGVSSQFITGLLFASALMHGDSRIRITGKLESKPYIVMTQRAMELFGVETDGFRVKGGQSFRSPGELTVEGDWSNGAFFLTAESLGNPVRTVNLSPDSPQGDRAAAALLPLLEQTAPTISAADTPDLVPILAVAASTNHGAVFTDIRRLRMKETDRVATVLAMINGLGGSAEATQDTLTVHAAPLIGGTVDATGDHRIAMSAAIAATVCAKPVTIIGADSVNKSYPKFWEEYRRLGGNYEQYLR